MMDRREPAAADRTPLSRPDLTTPRAAAVAGILFSLLLITSLALVRISVPADPRDAGAWLSGGSGRVSMALNLLPFAGIAFLWFIGVIRDRLGQREDKFFASVFFGSGLLFLAMMFALAGVAGGLLRVYGSNPQGLIDSGLYAFGRAVIYEMMNVYTMKMAGVFMISTCTLSLRTGIFPRWMAVIGFVLALFLLLSLGTFYWAPLVFPLWVLLISVHILLANLRRGQADGKTAGVTPAVP
jgi:MFS family permease